MDRRKGKPGDSARRIFAFILGQVYHPGCDIHLVEGSAVISPYVRAAAAYGDKRTVEIVKRLVEQNVGRYLRGNQSDKRKNKR